VIYFFGKRLIFAQPEQVDGKYEPIPFRLHELNQPLSRIPKYVVDTRRTWFEKDRNLFTYRGGRLPSIIFPEFPEGFRNKLTKLARSGDRRGIEFVMSMLRNYEGEGLLHDVLKDIIEALPANDPLLDEVEVILDSTGCVCGGSSASSMRMSERTAIEGWRSDSRANVRSFAECQLRSLERQIAAERRRGEEDLELRKRSHDEHGGEEAS
jgi:hypothetical protein